MPVQDMKHDDIAELVASRLAGRGFEVAFANMTSPTHGEQPDVLGINSEGTSILLEVKTSRSDFLADRRKPWRVDPTIGMGDYRVYVAPKGLLTPADIPYGWMLWEIHGTKRPVIKVIKGKSVKRVKPDKSCWSHEEVTYPNTSAEEYEHFVEPYNTKCYMKELTWTIKILRRMQDDGIDISSYSNNYRTP